MNLERVNLSTFGMFDENGPSEVFLKTINKLLSSTKTHIKGLDLLTKFLDNGTPDTFSKYAVVWLENCLKYADSREMQLVVMKKLIERYFMHDTSKKILEYLPKILDLCLVQSNVSDEVIAALNLLTVCMKQYGSWFTPHKSKIETFILSFLDYSSDTLMESAGVSYLYLQQVGNAGIDGANHRRNFQEALQKLCVTVQNLYDNFFINRIEISDYSQDDQTGLIFKEKNFSSQQMLEINARRIKNVLIFIQMMIKKAFPTQKDISPLAVINVIKRGIEQYHNHQNAQDFQFSIFLIKIQLQLIHLLHIFIIWLEDSILPFVSIVSKILIDSLKRCNNCKCFSLETRYQQTVYITLKYLVSRVTLNSYYQGELLTCIMKDITPIKITVILKIQADANSSKKKHQDVNKNINKSANEIEKDTLMCRLGLDVLISFFNYSSIQLDDKVIQNVYITVMSILNKINCSKPPHPYNNQKNQLKLYELLTTFYEQDTLKTLPSVSSTLNILNKHSTNLICKNSLNTFEKIFQPISRPYNTSFSSLSLNNTENEPVPMECFTAPPNTYKSFEEIVNMEDNDSLKTNLLESANPVLNSPKSTILEDVNEIPDTVNLTEELDVLPKIKIQSSANSVYLTLANTDSSCDNTTTETESVNSCLNGETEISVQKSLLSQEMKTVNDKSESIIIENQNQEISKPTVNSSSETEPMDTSFVDEVVDYNI